jgi:hypothetical protein
MKLWTATMNFSSKSFGVFIAVIALSLVGLFSNIAAEKNRPEQASGNSATSQNHDSPDMPGIDMGNDMPGMKMGPVTGSPASGSVMDGKDQQAEHGAVIAMSHMHHHQMGPHMYMTALRTATPQDWTKADAIVKELRETIERYKDYRVALSDGFRIFMPSLPQSEYHFTNYYNGFLESFSFDPSRPTSLLYRRTATGYELIGAMYTMPKRVSEEQLNERIPLGVAQWHLHTKLCMPPKEQRGHADLTKFGLQGSIITGEACAQAGGKFYPVIFGWMVHVYPFETTRQAIWGQ